MNETMTAAMTTVMKGRRTMEEEEAHPLIRPPSFRFLKAGSMDETVTVVEGDRTGSMSEAAAAVANRRSAEEASRRSAEAASRRSTEAADRSIRRPSFPVLEIGGVSLRTED